VLAESFGVDALRYFLLREVPFGQDGSYSAEAIVNRSNAELANSFGNLAQRTLSMIFKNLDGVLPAPGGAAEDRDLVELVRSATNDEVPEAFERFAFSVGIEAWLRAVFACNAYIDAQAPWTLRKTDPDRMAEVLGTLVLAVRELARAIAPIIPASSETGMNAPLIPPTEPLAIAPPFLTASVRSASAAVVPCVPARSNPIASMILATESPGTGVGASERSMMPNGIPSRRAASRPTSSPARASLNESFFINSASSCKGRFASERRTAS